MDAKSIFGANGSTPMMKLLPDGSLSGFDNKLGTGKQQEIASELGEMRGSFVSAKPPSIVRQLSKILNENLQRQNSIDSKNPFCSNQNLSQFFQ